MFRLCSQGGRCPGTERGVITSPNHPQNYPVKTDINYTIETLQGSLIELTFEAFDLEPGRTSGRGGCYDSLRLGVGYVMRTGGWFIITFQDN